MSKGLMAYEQPDSSTNDSSKRVPLIVGIAALVLVGVGGLVFFLRRGTEPAAVATTAAVSQSSMPEPTAGQSASQPSHALQQAPIQQATEIGSPSQLQAQPVVEQSHSAISAVPAVVTGAATSDLRTGSGLDSRNAKLEKNETPGRDTEPTSSRRPTISNLKMGAPKAPNKKLSGAGDLNAPVTDVASTQTVGSLAPAGLLTSAGRISSQPAPPSVPGSSPVAPSPVIPAASAPIAANKTVQDPKLISSPRLVYPQAARQSNIQGTVALSLNIDATGKVVGAEALSGPLLLRQPAIDSVKQWKYSPGLIDGKAAPSQTTVKVEFRLN
jgi:protein TonB